MGSMDNRKSPPPPGPSVGPSLVPITHVAGRDVYDHLSGVKSVSPQEDSGGSGKKPEAYSEKKKKGRREK